MHFKITLECVFVYLTVFPCVLCFQNSQRNLYWGQPGARFWSAVQYKQLARCTQSTQSTQCCSAWPQPRTCIRVPDSCSISCASCVWVKLFLFVVSVVVYQNLDHNFVSYFIIRGMVMWKTVQCLENEQFWKNIIFSPICTLFSLFIWRVIFYKLINGELLL